MAQNHLPESGGNGAQTASAEIRIGSTASRVTERYPGQLAGPDGVITEEIRLAIERFFAEKGF